MTNLNPHIDLGRIKELEDLIQQNEAHLRDCQNCRATPYLQQMMVAWAGTKEIDFGYVRSIVEYGLEELHDCLRKAKRGWSLMCFNLGNHA